MSIQANGASALKQWISRLNNSHCSWKKKEPNSDQRVMRRFHHESFCPTPRNVSTSHACPWPMVHEPNQTEHTATTRSESPGLDLSPQFPIHQVAVAGTKERECCATHTTFLDQGGLCPLPPPQLVSSLDQEPDGYGTIVDREGGVGILTARADPYAKTAKNNQQRGENCGGKSSHETRCSESRESQMEVQLQLTDPASWLGAGGLEWQRGRRNE
jgi:hypothetical protein